MEDKSKLVYIVLFSLLAVLVFLLEFFGTDGNGGGRREAMQYMKGNDSGSGSKPVGTGSNGRMMIYINWDGFAWYYYRLANSGATPGTPVINRLAEQGVLFSDVSSGIPSITNPMQTSILTGAWPSVTGNCYRYLDRKSGKLAASGRESKAENFAEAVNRQGFRSISIHQFILENRGTWSGSGECPYIQLGNHADYAKRFDEAIRYIRNLKSGSSLPVFLALYMDDLDGIGHNDWFTYGVPPVRTENERVRSILKRLGQMDAKLGELVQACKSAGISDRVSFLLTSDHGMTPYGIQNGTDNGCGYSKLPDLIAVLENMGYHTEVLQEGGTAKKDTNLILAVTGLQVQMFFAGNCDDAGRERIREVLVKEEYVGAVLDRPELSARGAAEEFADMLISAKPPYCFKTDKKRHVAGGQHDSLDESSQHVFALMWGRGVKKGLAYKERVYITDFAGTMSSLLGIDSPRDSTGRLLEGVLE